MFKQLILIFSLVSFLAVFAVAQEKPETEKKEKKDCSEKLSCCSGMKESSTGINMEKSSETASLQIWNKVCPIKGEEIDADAPTVEYKGKVIGFCCPGCDAKFQKDPEKYMKNLNEDGTKFIGKS
jgi:YHS domain-containing protein